MALGPSAFGKIQSDKSQRSPRFLKVEPVDETMTEPLKTIGTWLRNLLFFAVGSYIPLCTYLVMFAALHKVPLLPPSVSAKRYSTTDGQRITQLIAAYERRTGRLPDALEEVPGITPEDSRNCYYHRIGERGFSIDHDLPLFGHMSVDYLYTPDDPSRSGWFLNRDGENEPLHLGQ
jgi:hypothetical protein